jgi:phospholipid/cholesterol/gamma-HCH transport system substrate-binding protein
MTSKSLEMKVGLFVTIGIALTMIAILVLGSTESLFARRDSFSTLFNSVDGLIEGSKVVLNGIRVGTVERIAFDREKKAIRVRYSVEHDAADLLREDAAAEVATQGLLGDKYISIQAGDPAKPALPAGSEVPARPSKDLVQFINKGDQLMLSLNRLVATLDRVMADFEAHGRSEAFFTGMAASARNLSQASEKLNRELESLRARGAGKHLGEILEKINNGTGTLGKLVNDPSLYDGASSFVGGANRNRIIRNLVRKAVRDSEGRPDKEGGPDAADPSPAPAPAKR